MPSKANMIKYDVENHIVQKVQFCHTLETEIEILSVNSEESRRLTEEIRTNHECHTGTLPKDPEHAKRFLEDCEKLVNNPATTPVEHHLKAGAAFTLSMQLIRKEGEFPTHVQSYINREFTSRTANLWTHKHTTEQLTFSDQDQHNRRRRLIPRRVTPYGCDTIDESMADALLDNPDSIEDKTFIIPGSGPDDTKTFRVVGSGRSNKAAFWEILYGDAASSVRADRARMREVLVDSIAYED